MHLTESGGVGWREKKFVKIQIRSHLGGRGGLDGWMIFHKERGRWKKIKTTKGVTLFFMYYFDGASLDDGEQHILCLQRRARWCATWNFFRVRVSQDFLFYTFTPAKRWKLEFQRK